MSDWWGIVWLVVLLAANAFFVGAERSEEQLPFRLQIRGFLKPEEAGSWNFYHP